LSQVLNFSSVELNRFATQAKLLKKNLFFQATVIMRFLPKKNAGCPKAPQDFPPRKMAFSTPRRVVLELPSSSPRLCTGWGGTYADVTTKIQTPLNRRQQLPTPYKRMIADNNNCR